MATTPPNMFMIAKFLFSPRLLKIYKQGPPDSLYKPKGLEKWGDRVITSASLLFNITLYASPLIGLYMYNRDWPSYDELKYLSKILGMVSGFLAFFLLMRACGRAQDPEYVEFYKALERSYKQTQGSLMTTIQSYDFDFSAWPVSFTDTEATSNPWMNPFGTTTHANRPFYQRFLIQLLAYIAAHTFAIRLIYPGSLKFIQTIMWMPILQGRAFLVENHNGKRAKIKTSDGNHIDTMFVDNRWISPRGDVLVICCEGNSGFYEVGIMATPIRNGYSTLGWNHPGFGGSTGLPYPSQEHNAIKAVMKYAINKLNFPVQQIVMFGWSIGGYSAAWAASIYPVKGLVLDATFDDLLPLAENQMPASWSLLVKEVIRSYANLHVSEKLKSYRGPIHLVRRTDDEIICLRRGRISTNRANFLLMDLIRQRHPEMLRDRLSVLLTYAHMPVENRPEINDVMPFGEREVLSQLDSYMRDYRSSHCTPLPEPIFQSIMESLVGPVY